MAPPGNAPELPGFDADEGPAGPTPLQWARLLLGAARRRKLLATLVLLAGIAASVAYLARKQPMYRVEAKILAQRPQALPSAARTVYEDIPTRSAWEMVHRRENLIALIRETNLLAGTSAPSAPKHGWYEWLQSRAVDRPPLAAADPLDALVTVLDRRLLVAVEDGTITISLDWENPQQAYDLVRAALQNFLEARHLQEVASIDEVISVLEGRAEALRHDLDAAIQEASRSPARTARPATPRVRQPSQELVRLHSLLESKQRAIQDVEDFRRRRLADLQAQLDQARNTLSDAHPTVISLRKDIEALSVESPQIATLREAERQARQQYNAHLAQEGFQGASAASAVTPAPVIDLGARPEEDQRVREDRIQYEQMVARLNTAQVERDAARAAFKYRYNVIWPPQLPQEPVSPKPKLLGAAMLGSLVLALLAAAAPDLWAGRIVERWQVERSLHLTVLGEIHRPR